MEEKSYGSVKLSKLQKILAAATLNPMEADPDVPFEYLIASAFPHVIDNIKAAMRNAYDEGVKAGFELAKGEK